MKFEMMYQSRMFSSKIVMKAMQLDSGILNAKIFDTKIFLETLKHCRFEVGYYDNNKQPLYTEIDKVNHFDTDFFVNKMKCYTVTVDKSEHLGVRYIVLKESNLSESFKELRIKIIGYLVLSFILMGVVGYFLSRLFLKPVREQIESLDKFISDTTHELKPLSQLF